MAIQFGIMAAIIVLVFYARHKRTAGVMLAVMAAAVAAAAYAFIEGVWPLGAIEAVWAITVARKWWTLSHDQPDAGIGA
jgi:hypothetical protein